MDPPPPPPPPPPPHGSHQQSHKSGGLPPGNYDIFVIPPHASGSGFLYLPSLQTHRNSFLAGVACTAAAFVIWSVVLPVLKEWFNTLINGGGPGVMVLLAIVAIAAWAFGKTQGEGSSPGTAGTGAAGTAPPGASAPGAGAAPQPGPPPAPGSTHVPPPPPPPPPPNPSAGAPPPPRSSWQRPNPQTAGASSSAKYSWERAREETRKKEEERKKAEEAKKRREEAEKQRQKQREKDAREREERERKQRAEKAEQEKAEREQVEKERAEREKAEREKAEREKEELEKVVRKKVAREMVEREKAEQEKAEREEKAERAKKEREAAIAKARERIIPKKPPYPTVRTETEDDAYSFRPYDRPKRAVPKAGSTASTYSESSYAASHTTARTTPPPSSHRGPYSTKDPDKIIIKAVYSFNNAFQRTPVSQLISGQGNVTDGLILRITTEGLFIDDDVRGVPQREWDVKAWTMKMAEVWCPHFIEGSTSLPTENRSFSFVSPKRVNGAASRQIPNDEQSQETIRKLSRACLQHCKYVKHGARDASRISESSGSSFRSSCPHASGTSCSTTATFSSPLTDDMMKQSGELSGLHVLRASIRDQEGKKYVFILSQTEGWKVAVGLQRLRRGTQVRALGISGMPANETKALIENLGWA